MDKTSKSFLAFILYGFLVLILCAGLEATNPVPAQAKEKSHFQTETKTLDGKEVETILNGHFVILDEWVENSISCCRAYATDTNVVYIITKSADKTDISIYPLWTPSGDPQYYWKKSKTKGA